MEVWLAALQVWAQNVSAWLQAVTGMTLKDIALFLGGIVMVLSVLLLGLYSGKPRYREGARFAWFLLILASLLIVYGLYHHNPTGDS